MSSMSSWNKIQKMYIYFTLFSTMEMTLKEYLDSKRKEQINKKENRPMKVKVKEIIEYYTRFEKDERDTENKYDDESSIKDFISKYVDENRND